MNDRATGRRLCGRSCPRKPGRSGIAAVGRDLAATVGGTSPGREALEWLVDVIRGRRALTQVKVLERTERAICDANLKAGVVPAKLLFPLLEYAGLEDPDDDQMVDRWANLLANAATTAEGEHIAFPVVLSQLEPLEARMLDTMHQALLRELNAERESSHHLEGFGPRFFKAGLDIDDWHCARATANLLRLQLVVSLGRNDPPHVLNTATNTVLSSAIQLTQFGAAFVVACQPPASLQGYARIDMLSRIDP